MPDITREIEAVGNDPIKNLFRFVMSWNDVSVENGDTIDQFMAERTLLEVGEAIHLYAKWKELKCRESKP